MKSTYEAAWLPIGYEAPGEDPVALAVKYIEQQCKRTRKKGVLVTHTRRDAATPSLDRLAREQVHVTRRSRAGASPGAGPVLVDMPDTVLLEYAHRLAKGSSLCAVESAVFRLSGWAAATAAINVATGEPATPPGPGVMELLDHLVTYGNSGYANAYDKRMAQNLLGELSAAVPEFGGDFIAGYVIACGISAGGAERLRQWWA